MGLALAFFIIYLAFAAADFAVAVKSWQRGSEAARTLGNCMGGAALMTLSYLVSIEARNYWIATIANALCFAIIDMMLAYLLCFFLSFLYTKIKRNRGALWVIRIFMALTVCDIASVLLNPIFGHVASYYYLGPDRIPHYLFQAHTAYGIHLALCYAMLLFGFGIMAYEAVRIPRMYRAPINRILGCVLGITLFNAIYLVYYSSRFADFTLVTYSILGYGIYLSAFVYGSRSALERTAKSILDASTQPALIFDHKGELFFYNASAKELFPELKVSDEPISYKDFFNRLDLNSTPRFRDDKSRFYWTPAKNNDYSYICDYQEIMDGHGRCVARSLVFTNNTLSMDPLTGYLTELYFEMHDRDLSDFDEPPVSISVCDLTQLGLLNNAMGYNRGDEAIALQAKILRETLPPRTIFARLHDARLACICYGMETDEVKACLERANEELGTHADFSMRLKMNFATCMLEDGETVVGAAERATSALKTHKLLDEDSDHSNTLESLTQMLSEIDGETEAHVRRTRMIGDSLAFELGLSDYERDQLSLLCLFHDIGKVGIPHNILNKPGGLTDAERAVMREHALKGYRIARATAGLEIVAEPILHHHERWDGSGYPDGLQHEAIPILSRIISVVDSYDAMVSDRPYHAGISNEEACDELMRCAGTQFDPYVVNVFVRMMGRAAEAASTVQNGESEPGQHQTMLALEEALAPQAAMLGNVSYTHYTLDEHARITNTDAAFELLTGYTAYDVETLSLTQNDLLFKEDRDAYWERVNEYAANTGVAYMEHRLRRKDGTGRYVYCLGIDAANGNDTEIFVTDITDSLSMKHQVNIARNRAMMSLNRLEESIRLDPLTSLLNKPAFRKSCERILMDDSSRCALIMLDADDFKSYNDTYGHPEGDGLLVKIAEALSNACGSKGFAGRVGGDEFCCALTFAEGTTLAEIRGDIRRFWDRLNNERMRLSMSQSFSAGAAVSKRGEIDFESLYVRADEKLYQAKREGKGRICFDSALK